MYRVFIYFLAIAVFLWLPDKKRVRVSHFFEKLGLFIHDFGVWLFPSALHCGSAKRRDEFVAEDLGQPGHHRETGTVVRSDEVRIEPFQCTDRGVFLGIGGGAQMRPAEQAVDFDGARHFQPVVDHVDDP